jgi:dihydropteroate synthase
VTVIRARTVTLSLSKPALMGVVNVNADSFSDPGPRTPGAAVQHALGLIASGADLVDVGAQSSITMRSPVDADLEAAAVVPVVRALVRAAPAVVISVDTFKAAVAEAALAAGAHIINDVSGLRDAEIARACARYGAGLVVMHTSAPPLTRRQDPDLYRDIAAEVAAFLARKVDAAIGLGVARESIIVDPGPDFTKTPAQTIALLRGIDRVVALGYPILLALSRKDFVGALTDRRPAERGAGTLGGIAAMRHVPNQILRVHDVAATADMLAVHDALDGAAAVPRALALREELRHQATQP